MTYALVSVRIERSIGPDQQRNHVDQPRLPRGREFGAAVAGVAAALCAIDSYAPARTQSSDASAASRRLSAALMEFGSSASVRGERPRVGGWGLLLFLFGFLAGLIGWLQLRRDDAARAEHVFKWGLIWTLVSIAAWGS